MNKLKNLEDLYKSEQDYGDALINELSSYSNKSSVIDTILINKKLDSLKVEMAVTKKSIDSILSLE